MMATPTLSKRRIAIFEDNTTNRERLSGLVKLCGGVAVPVDGRAPQLAELKSFFRKEKIELVMCDHHLFQQGDYATYYGAAAVAESYQQGIGGILVTAFEKDDADLSLRRHRRWIPALINSPDLDRSKLQAALLQADREVREKQPTRERVPHRAIMTVQRIESRGSQKVVKVLMSQWNSIQEVGFPLEMVPAKIQPIVKIGQMLIAEVNIEAARAEDLFFDKFELPDTDVLKKSKTILGRP